MSLLLLLEQSLNQKQIWGECVTIVYVTWMDNYTYCQGPITFLLYPTVESVFWKEAISKVMCFSMNLHSASTDAILLAIILKTHLVP
jgi:hypothetical protein